MRTALDVFWETVRDWYNGMVGLATMNFIWLLMSLTVVLLPPATAGLYVVTNSIARGTGGRIEDFAAGARAYAWLSFRWALVNVAVGVVFAVNFSYYGATGTFFGAVVQMILAAAGLLWIAVQFYVWPFLIEQEKKQVRLALKNALFLTLANPIYTFIMLGAVGMVLVVSLIAILPVAVFATSFVSLLGNRAVIERLRTYGKLPGPSHLSGEEL
jgi:hypothetical protein